MLIRFIFEEFPLSYRDRTVFSMAAGKGSRHGEHVCECNGQRLLRSAFVFGANAGGKSNLLRRWISGAGLLLRVVVHQYG